MKVALGVNPRYAKSVALELDAETVVAGCLRAFEAALRATLRVGAPDGSDPEPTTVSVPLPVAAAGKRIDASTVPARTTAVTAEVPMATVVEVGMTGVVAGGVVELLFAQPTPRATNARATAGMRKRSTFMDDLSKNVR